MRPSALVLALALSHLALPAAAQPVELGDGPVLMTADELRYDEARGLVVAEGDVDLSRDARRLLADRLTYDQRSDRVVAEGNVVLLEPTGEALFADRVELTGDLREGAVEQLEGLLADDSRFAAARGTREAGNLTRMQRVVYSPCEICPDSPLPPLWQISAREMVHDQAAQEVSYRHATFDLFGIPVAYTPYFAHPDPTVDRRTGLLTPTLKSDGELGFWIETPYHVVLAPNRDVTLSPIVTTKEGPVLAAEYRELRTRGPLTLDGSITHGSTFDDPAGVRRERKPRGHVDGIARWDLRDDLGPGWRAGADLALSTDKTYRKRYRFGSESILTNRAFAERIWDRNYGVIAGYGFQGLRDTDRQGEIPIVLPLAETSLVGERGWRGSRWVTDASLVALSRTDGLDTRRVSAEGGWELPWRGPIGDLYELRVGLRGDLYHTTGDPLTFSNDGGSETVGRVLPSAVLDWRWPLVRNQGRWHHLVEPVASARVSPYGGNDERIPNEDSVDFEFDDTNLFKRVRFTGLDRVEGGPRLAYGLRFTSQGPGVTRVSGLLGQSWRPRRDDTFPRGSGLEGRFSDYVGRIEARPVDWLDVGYRFRLKRDQLRVMRNDVRLSLGPPRLRLDLNYLRLADQPDEDEFRRREEITATLHLRLRDDLAFSLRTRRDLTDNATIANTIGMVYNNPCLILVAGLEQSFTRTRDVRPTTTVTVRATFRNLGEVTAATDIPNRS
jgi:LPS-assembly protein